VKAAVLCYRGQQVHRTIAPPLARRSPQSEAKRQRERSKLAKRREKEHKRAQRKAGKVAEQSPAPDVPHEPASSDAGTTSGKAGA
jgi:hypothetical protein